MSGREEEIANSVLFDTIRPAIIDVLPFGGSFEPPHIGRSNAERNIQIQELVELLTGQNRIIYVTGEQGLGKTEIVKAASVYCYERRKFRDGVVLVDFREVHSIYMLHELIGDKMNIQLPSFPDLCRSIHPRRLLIIMDSLDDMLIKERDALTLKLR
jgi:hypothetical protein